MSILHGNWISRTDRSYFFLWGENWRSLATETENLDSSNVARHPFNCDRQELVDKLGKNKKFSDEWEQQIIVLPSYQKSHDIYIPILAEQTDKLETIESIEIVFRPWLVEGLILEATQAKSFLNSLPLGITSKDLNYYGEDLRFWSHIYRWSLDLIKRKKFLPKVETRSEDRFNLVWQPLLDSSIDRDRLAHFISSIPTVCCSYLDRSEVGDLDNNFKYDDSRILILDFLSNILDREIRSLLANSSFDVKLFSAYPWLQSLAKPVNSIKFNVSELKRLQTALSNWTIPIQEYLFNFFDRNSELVQYRLCLRLQPPAVDRENKSDNRWQLTYGLQALDDANFVIDASIVWQHPEVELTWDDRIIANPQETFLKGLGLAAKIYQPIADSLQENQPESCPLDSIEVYQFLRSTAWQLEDCGIGLLLPDGLATDVSEQRLGIKISAEVANKKNERLSLKSLLNYKLQIAIGDRVISQADFAKLLAQKSPIVELNGSWIALQPADVRAAQQILDNKNEALELSVEDALRLATGDVTTLAKLPVVNFEATGVLQGLIDNLTDNKSIAPITEIAGLNGKLRPYQERGVSWLAFLEQWSLGSCLADDMGLGKTLQVIAFMLHLKAEGKLFKPSLIVCPTSVVGNWEKEIKKFAPSLTVLVHHGDKRKQNKNFERATAGQDLVITSYALIQRDLKILDAIDWEGIILDEAQNIKNPNTKQAQAVRKLTAGFRICLTGTPVENRLSDLWAIVDFLNPGFLGTSQFFQKRFAIPIEKYGDRQSLQILRSLVQPFILRRLKTDRTIIQDLPEKQEMNVFCGLALEQADLYQKLVENSLQEIDESTGIQRRGLILTLLLRLKQLCDHPVLIRDKNNAENSSPDLTNFAQRSGKLLRLEEMLEEVIAEESRALVFTQFSEWGKLLQLYLAKRLNAEILFLYGGTSAERRQEMVDRFQNDPNAPPVFILSLKAGGTGLNLTRADRVFHFDRWWNPAVENQATDRAFRIGQTRNVQVHKFVCTGTLEEKINDILESKKDLADRTVDAGENWLTELDTQQLRNLLLLDRSAIIDSE
jgi:SNF2 family DNA or RNA helicase